MRYPTYTENPFLFRIFIGYALLLFTTIYITKAQSINLKNATILVSDVVPMPMRITAPKMLVEEIEKRTNLKLQNTTSWHKNENTIALVLSTENELKGRVIPKNKDRNSSEYKPEGYRIATDNNTIWIIGADARGVLFGVGWLLRNLSLEVGAAYLDTSVNIATAPQYPIRGHQLGYRNTANSYDAWSIAQYEQYIRELAIFGTNAIENIPFHENEINNPHFKIPAAEMRVKIGEICQQYDIDHWIWTPVTFDLANKEKRAAELQRHEDFYSKCPRLNHVFVPGGDPGHNHPSEVLPFLKDLYHVLIKYHPQAQIWLSLQGFSVEQTDYFYQYLAVNKPEWLAGVVSGPGSPPMSETRYRLPLQYKHRQYPDITHNVRCEFPVRAWDQAFALTLGREASNPRPYAFAEIHKNYAPFTDGFVAYSDGCHDDVNKIVWSMRAWNPTIEVRDILTDYTRLFFGKAIAHATADGIAALENNWKGSLIQNGGVEATFSFWQNLESANPALKDNWRWQMLLLRAYYDTYTRRRLIYEQSLEKEANTILLLAKSIGSQQAMNKALEVVSKAETNKIAGEVKQKIEELCAHLFTSIGLQTSVPLYKASGYERGAILDFVEYPLNNRWWLADQFNAIATLPTEQEKLQKLTTIATWENPGQGSFYDDVSNTAKGTRIKTISEDATDVAWWDNGMSRVRLSSQLFQKCPELEYNNLMPNARYIIRVAGEGEALLRVDGKRLEPIMYNREPNSFKEWIVPLILSQDGTIRVTFDEPEESHLNWRKQSKISDIWLLKQ